jgi:hypothetical protein
MFCQLQKPFYSETDSRPLRVLAPVSLKAKREVVTLYPEGKPHMRGSVGVEVRFQMLDVSKTSETLNNYVQRTEEQMLDVRC